VRLEADPEAAVDDLVVAALEGLRP